MTTISLNLRKCHSIQNYYKSP